MAKPEHYKPDDIVEIDINSCEGLEPEWVPGVVTAATASNGRTMATVSDGIYVGLFSRDGWEPSELRLGPTIRGWEYTYSDDGKFAFSVKPIRVGDTSEEPPKGWLQQLRRLFKGWLQQLRRLFKGGQANG